MQKVIYFFLIFLSGIGLNLTPCVYPLIPITVSYFGAKDIKEKPYVHAAVYICGIALTNSFLALFSTFTGKMLGSVLQSPYVTVGISTLLLLLALSLFGYWEIKMPPRINRLLSKQFSGYKSSFFIGLLFGVFAAPCVGPFIIGLMLYIAKNADPITGFLYFFCLSLGMGVPIGILATFSGMLSRLPSSGEWMVWIRRLFAWVLIFMSLYMLRSVLGRELERYALSIMFFLCGIHLGILDKSRIPVSIRYFTIILSTAASFWIYFSYSPSKINWILYNEKIIEEAKREGRPIIIDFYADWCFSCRELEKRLFYRSDVVEMSKKFLMVKVDLTKPLPEQKELLRKFDIKGVPTIVFITKDKVTKLEGKIKEEEFIKKMREALSQYQASSLSYPLFQNQ